MTKEELIDKSIGFRYVIECYKARGCYSDKTIPDGFVIDLFNDVDFDNDDIDDLLELGTVTIGSCCNTYHLLEPKGE